uniref:carbohydrate sulfotransferase 14-like n=1 Tax=Styela clava TaxID=7725 RepID=UPI001939E165
VKSWLAHELGDKHLDLKNIKNVTEIQKRLDTYQKLIIVRDPLYRLLSAYINKLEHEYPWNRGFAKISKYIHQQFVKNETGKLASFGEFVFLPNRRKRFLVCEIPKCGCSSIKKLLLITEGIVNETNPQTVKSWLAHELGDKHLDLKTSKMSLRFRSDSIQHEYPWNRGFAKISKYIHQQFVKNETGKLASFGEFVSYLTEENEYDRHWELYHKLCLPCSISYDYIAHIETIDDDMVDFMDKLAITNITFPRNNEKSKQTNTDTFERYIGEVPENLVKGIRKKYKTDFDLFGFK